MFQVGPLFLFVFFFAYTMIWIEYLLSWWHFILWIIDLWAKCFVKLFLRYIYIYFPFSNAFYFICWTLGAHARRACWETGIELLVLSLCNFFFFSFYKIIFKVNLSTQSWCKVSNNTTFVKIELILTAQSDILMFTLRSRPVSPSMHGCELRRGSGSYQGFCGAGRALKPLFACHFIQKCPHYGMKEG